MRTDICVKGLEKTDSLENYLLAHIESVIEPYTHFERGAHLRVTVDEEAHRMQSRKPQFVCDVYLKMDSSSKVFKVTKHDPDFYICVHEAGLALKNSLQKYRGKRKVHRRFEVPLVDNQIVDEDIQPIRAIAS